MHRTEVAPEAAEHAPHRRFGERVTRPPPERSAGEWAAGGIFRTVAAASRASPRGIRRAKTLERDGYNGINPSRQMSRPTEIMSVASATSRLPFAGRPPELDARFRDLIGAVAGNHFTCMPDNPATPGPDPMCMDQNALAWVTAWVEHKEPPKGKVGFIYMLAGGTDASNTDPYAQKPEANNNWIETGPHVMIVGVKEMVGGYPRAAKPDTSEPYVMWPDTPYEHLMIPVQAEPGKNSGR